MPRLFSVLALAKLDAVARLSAVHLVNTAVESMLLAVIAYCVVRLLNRENAGTRFAVWMATLMAIAALPLAGVVAHAGSAQASTGGGLTVPSQWALYMFVAWAAIAGAMLLRLLAGVWQLGRLRASATEVRLETLDALPRQTISEFQAVRRVVICICDAVSVPTAVGFFRPAVLLPAWTLSELSPSDLNAVLLHELAHLRRRDDWTNLLQKLLRAVLFFSPAVWWIEGRLSLEREMACDEHVLANAANPRAYAECLVNLAEKGMLHRAAVVLAQGAVHRLRQCSLRVARILEVSTPRRTRAGGVVVVAAGMASLASLMLLAHAPNVIAFRTASPAMAVNVTPQRAVTGDEARTSARDAGASTMLVKANWQVAQVVHERQLTHSIKKVAHKKAFGGDVQQRTNSARNAVLPLYRAEFAEPPSVPATMVVVTERSFYSADGRQFWTLSVYRFVILPGVNSSTQDEPAPKRI